MFEGIVALAWLVAKIALALLGLYCLAIVYFHFRAVNRLNYYEKQGAVLFPGCKRFFFGNIIDLIEYSKERQGSAEPIPGP